MSTKRKMKWWWWAVIIAVPLLIIAAILKAKNKPKGQEVNLEKVERRDIIENP